MTKHKTVQLSEIAEINPRLTTAGVKNETVSFVPMSAVCATTATITTEESRSFEDVSKGYTSFMSGDILIAKITPCFENGKIALANLTHHLGFGSTEFHVVRSKEGKLDNRYALHFLRQKSVRLAGAWRMTGSAGQRRVPVTFLSDLKIPLPPLEEQKRIAELLDKADGLRRKRRQAIDTLDTLTQSIFLNLFGDPVTNPKKWKSVHLIEIADIVSGVTKGKKFGDKKTVHVPYMRVANVQDGTIRLDDVAEIEVLPKDVDRYRLLKGDILLTEGGDPDKLGRGAVWNGSIDPCIHQNHIFRVRIFSSAGIPEYISAVIASPLCKRYFFRCAKQTTGIASINMTQLKDCPVLLPPKDLQEEFSKRCTAIETQRTQLIEAQTETENLFISLQQKAFHHEN